jgi:hypothetical protein
MSALPFGIGVTRQLQADSTSQRKCQDSDDSFGVEGAIPTRDPHLDKVLGSLRGARLRPPTCSPVHELV